MIQCVRFVPNLALKDNLSQNLKRKSLISLGAIKNALSGGSDVLAKYFTDRTSIYVRLGVWRSVNPIAFRVNQLVFLNMYSQTSMWSPASISSFNSPGKSPSGGSVS